jgi:predicted metallo-beta-lactamase superfamily hydrolase
MPSRVIRHYHYDHSDRHLDLVFVSGRQYRYHDVPEEVYREMRRAFSTGEFFNARIRDQFRHTRVN